jgi:hypothetical protein
MTPGAPVSQTLEAEVRGEPRKGIVVWLAQPAAAT